MTLRLTEVRTRYLAILKMIQSGRLKDNLAFSTQLYNLRAATFIAQLRETVNRIRRKEVGFPEIDPEQLVAEWDKYRLEGTDYLVTFRLRKQEEKPVDFIPQEQGVLTLSGAQEDEVQAVILLLSRRVLSGPVRINREMSQALADQLMSTHDIFIELHPDHTIIL